MWLGLWLWGGAQAATDEVANGWYLWRTGRDDAALTIANSAVQKDPSSLGAHMLRSAMRIVASEGASNEAWYREWWGEDTADPVRRVALAMAISLRHAAPGAWCEEVSVLVLKVTDGAPHYYATLIDRERERRCTGQSGHADAEMRRLAKGEGPGWVDGVLAEMESGYIKVELPDKLERAWAEQPVAIDRAAALWGKTVAGPGRAAAKHTASRAIDSAVASTDPVLVHAALLALRASDQTKEALDAESALRTLDPGADVSLSRAIADVRDPDIYDTIDMCKGNPPSMAADCIGSLLQSPSVAPQGSVRAYAEMQRRLMFDLIARPDDAYLAAKAAYEADPSHRFNGRVFARMALAHNILADTLPGAGDDLALAVEAADNVLFGRVPEGDRAKLKPDLAPVLARDLEVRGQLLGRTGRHEEALADLLLAEALETTVERKLRVGMALAAVSRGDEAALTLAHGLVTPSEDTALVSAARRVLGELSVGWDPGGLKAMIDAAARRPGDKAPPHPLLGKRLIDAALLPTPAAPAAPQPGVKAKKPKPPVAVIFTWASWAPDSIAALGRASALLRLYRERGVAVVVLGVDASPAPLPEVLLEELAASGVVPRAAGPSAMRALMSAALPTVLVVDGTGVVKAALSPYDRGTLDLESALDALLPPAP